MSDTVSKSEQTPSSHRRVQLRDDHAVALLETMAKQDRRTAAAELAWLIDQAAQARGLFTPTTEPASA